MAWMELAQAEREDFAAFLETLSPEQWEAPTLCDRWNVRQVAAHAISFDELSRGESVRRFLKGLLHGRSDQRSSASLITPTGHPGNSLRSSGSTPVRTVSRRASAGESL